MRKRLEQIEAPSLNRKQHLWCYGHFGAPLLVFPSAAGFAHEWDAHSMVTALESLILGGKIKLYCTESNVSQSWTAKNEAPAKRLENHLAFEQYVLGQLVPWIREDCHVAHIPIAVAGCSLGGFYAANFALKFPETFRYALCMSGRYDMEHFLAGESGGDLYFNNPLVYVRGLNGQQLEKVRQTHISLVCGRGAFEEGCIEETVALGKLLQKKNIPNYIDIWGVESRHDWAWWKRQAIQHLTKRFG